MTYLFKKYEYILIVDKGLLKGFTLQKNRPLGTTDLYCITLIQEEKKINVYSYPYLVFERIQATLASFSKIFPYLQ